MFAENSEGFRKFYMKYVCYFLHLDYLSVFQTLDPSKQRALSGYLSQSSSSQSIISERDSLPVSHRSAAYALHKSNL